MSEMQLVASRFVVMPDASVIDLATGARVVLTIATAGGVSEQTRWAVRCDTLRAWRHPSIAPLVDFGALGDGQRFEAWRCGGPWTGQLQVAAQVHEQAVRILEACGLSAGDLSIESMRNSSRGPVLLPSPETGYRQGRDRPDRVRSTDACAIALIDRPVVTAIAELFDVTTDCRPRLVSLWGPADAGRSTAIGELARAARMKGLVPVEIALLASPLRPQVDGRTLFIVNDSSGTEGWDALMHSLLRSPRPHVVVSAGEEEAASACGVALRPLSVDALAGAVRPAGLAPAIVNRILRIAERAHGRPGRFAALMWSRPGDAGARERRCRRARVRGGAWAAEQSSVYGWEEVPPELGTPADHPASTWPAPGEMAGLRRRMDGALRLLAAGRHAPGDRALRQAVGGLARRADWTQAAQGAKALAASLLKRGKAQEARAAIDEARDYCARSGRDDTLLDVATIAGHAWLDLARLDEAESVLTAAVEAAKARADHLSLADASLAMARCLFWRGRYAEAEATLSDVPAPVADQTAIHLAIAASRHAVGSRDLGRAVSAAAEACQRAQTLRDPGLQGAAAYASAFVHLAVNDLDAVARDVAGCIASARRARDPLRAVRARVLLAECDRRRSTRSAPASSRLFKLIRLNSKALPPIVRVRCRLLDDLLKGDAPLHEVVSKHTTSSGLMALALWTPDRSSGENGAGLDAMLDGLVGILRVCQDADEEASVLSDVCARLRHQLRAAAVAFAGAEPASALAMIASDGGRIDLEIARRAVEAGIAIAPRPTDDRIEAAVPVRYGGATIAALVARWTLGTTHPLSNAATVLTMGATAAAPAVAAAIARRRTPVSPGSTELLGVSTAMADVRRAVERAAAAPFCVLIEGESGCGKELVARAVHRCGPRRDRVFSTLNCAALPDDLVESELFGHARGAFTGAAGERPGVFEEAHGGTLFLDEIGELSLRAQAKVLRVIQEGELRRVGENIARRVDVRILCATNRNLRDDVAAGRFRLDLLYRLDVLRIVIPPLRDRREDIAELADQYWRDAARRVGSHAALAAATVAALARYDWPGNVRELQNVLAALAVRTPKRGVIAPPALPPQFGIHRADDTWRLDEARRTFDARFVRAALVRAGGCRTQAASELGVTRQGLVKLMSRLGITDEAGT